MDLSDLQDDIVKLSEILNERDLEDLDDRCDSHSRDSQDDSGKKSKGHPVLVLASPLTHEPKFLILPHDVQENTECEKLDNTSPSLLEPDVQRSNTNWPTIVLSNHNETRDPGPALQTIDDECMDTHDIGDPLPPDSPPPLSPPTSSPPLLPLTPVVSISDETAVTQENPDPSLLIPIQLQPPPASPTAANRVTAESSSQVQGGGMPLPPPAEDVLHDFEVSQESCTPDFDPPDAIRYDTMDTMAHVTDMGGIPKSVGSEPPGCQDTTSGDWVGAQRSAALDGDIGMLSQMLDIPATVGEGDRVGEEDVLAHCREDISTSTSSNPAESSALQGDINKLSQVFDIPATVTDGSRRGEEDILTHYREDINTSASADPAESSALQGDINKLSRVLATAPVAPPIQLDPVGGKAAASSPSLPPSVGRAGASSCASGGQPSTASVSGLQLSSLLGDELLSQDDFLDDTFIGQEIPVNLENCLALNFAYQEVVDENLSDLEELLRRNRAQQAELAAVLSSKQDSGSVQRPPTGPLPKRNWHQFMFQHFSDSDGFGPAANADTRTKTKQNEYEAMRYSRPWLQSEREKLFEAVLAEVRRRQVQAAHHRVGAVRNSLRTLEETAATEQTQAALVHLKIELEKAQLQLLDAQEGSLIDALTEMDDEYDWTMISQMSFDSQRTAMECRMQWCNFVRPTISHAEWTREEDQRVRAAAADRCSANRWQAAADELGRTAFQVFQRWIAVLSVPKRSFWSSEESQTLDKAVRQLRNGQYVNWSQVAMHLPGRSAVQCYNRFTTVNSEWRHGRRYGRFTLNEDMRLIAAIEEAGINDYHTIARYIPRRSVDQLKNRYTRYLSPNISWREWTREEDEQLVRFVCEHGPLWARAAAEIGNGRIGTHCRMRFRRIECAFQNLGGVPATGSLGGKIADYCTNYYTTVRERLKHHLDDQKPAKNTDPAEARREAGLTFLNRRRPGLGMTWKPGQGGRKRSRNAWGKRSATSSKRRQVKWESIDDIMNSEGRRPHSRVADSAGEAEVAALTARAWCLPPPTRPRLEQCAAAGPPASRYDTGALYRWHDALLPDAPDCSLRQATSALGQGEFNWRRMPLLPASFASCSAFRSLLLHRPRLEDHAMQEVELHLRRKKIVNFNQELADWAQTTVSGVGDAGDEADALRLMPAGPQSRHHERMVRVRITEQPPGGSASRQFYLTVAAEEAEDPDQLAARILRQVPHMVKMDICRRRRGAGAAPPPGPPPAASAADAWHLLLARFVSIFFWPAVLSLQPPPGPADLEEAPPDKPSRDASNKRPSSEARKPLGSALDLQSEFAKMLGLDAGSHSVDSVEEAAVHQPLKRAPFDSSGRKPKRKKGN